MNTCIICHFDTELDDVMVAGESGRVVCLRCWARETDTALPMPKPLQRELTNLLATVESA